MKWLSKKIPNLMKSCGLYFFPSGDTTQIELKQYFRLTDVQDDIQDMICVH